MKDRDRIEDQLLEEIDFLRQRNQELERASRVLRASDREKEDALHRVSHELRTPVAAIRSFAEILLQYPDEDSKTIKEYISIILEESKRLGRLIDSLMEMSKIERGKADYRFARIRIQPLVEETARAFRGLLSDRGLILNTTLGADLPAVVADSDRVRQLLNNVVGNAIEFTPPGGRISVEAEYLEREGEEAPAGFIHLKVRDTGIGIKPEDLPYVFDRFRQCGDALMKKPVGLGLGLFICKEIVSAHHGNIWVESIHGEGSTFHISLPAEMSGQDAYDDSAPSETYVAAEHAEGLLPAG